MKVLVVGGAGYVGTILRPALEAVHEVRHFDRVPVPGAEERTVVADVNDGPRIQEAMTGIEAVLYLAMGVVAGKNVSEVNPAFDVNVRGMYRFLSVALASGASRFVYASTLSVYTNVGRSPRPFTETHPPDAWDVYGASKRLGEQLCLMASQKYPQACISVLRLMLPRNEEDFPPYRFDVTKPEVCYAALGPNDTRRLFVAALACARPGVHVIHATGDLVGKQYDHSRARDLLGWLPQGN